MPIPPIRRRAASSLTQPAAREVIRLAGFLTSGLKLIALCAFIVAVGMLSPRLTPDQGGVVALVGFAGVAAGAVAFWVAMHGMRRLEDDSAALRLARLVQVVLRRLGLPILALGFFLLWTFVYLALWWYHPAEAFTGLPRGVDPRFADFFYYSVMTAFISPPGDIIAASRGTRSATMIEMLTGLSLLATYLSSLVEWPARDGGREEREPNDQAESDAGPP